MRSGQYGHVRIEGQGSVDNPSLRLAKEMKNARWSTRQLLQTPFEQEQGWVKYC